ncbi:MAG: hypothetical protein NC332_04385 [Firmicutes bacterium]|nr:hypothetical protein [Bacillota bacterium]
MKKISVILALFTALTLVFAACNTEHDHTYSEQWTRNETHHWRNPTCDDTDTVADYAEHNFVNGVCDVCNYQKPAPPAPVTPPHTHTYSENYAFDEAHHWRSPTCDDTTDVADYGSHTYNESYKCSACGITQKASDIIAEKIRNLDYAYTLCASDIAVTVSDEKTVECEYLELYLSVSDNDKLQGRGYAVFDLADGSTEQTVAGEQTATLVIEDDVAYIVLERGDGADCLLVPAQKLLEQAGIETEDVREALANLDEQSDAFAEYLIEAEQIAEILQKRNNSDLSDKILVKDDVASADGQEVYYADFNVLRALNAMFAEVTVQQYVDGVMGDGFYDEIDSELATLLQEKTIGSVLETLEESGITVDDITFAADLLVKLFADGYDGIDDLLSKIGVFGYAPTFKDLLNNPFFNKMPLGFVIDAVLDSVATANGSEALTVADMITAVKAYSEAYRDFTLYDLILEENGAVSSSELFEVLDYALAEFAERAQLRLVYSDDVLQSVTLSVSKSAEAEETLFEEDAENVAKMKAAIDFALNSFCGEISLIRDYETEIDYSDVAETVGDNVAQTL